MEGPPAWPQLADYYREIYARGMGGEQPSIPVSVAELERAARPRRWTRAPPPTSSRGAGSEDTMRANLRGLPPLADRAAHAARRRRARPAHRACSAPRCRRRVLLAPIGVQTIVHPDGELRHGAGRGRARAADRRQHRLRRHAWRRSPRRAARGRAGTSSTGPTTTSSPRASSRRAEAAGYAAIVVTVDTFIPGWKPRDLQQAWLPFLEGVGNANYLQDPVFRAALEKTPEEDLGAAVGHYLGVYVNPALTWDDLDWLRETDLAADPAQGDPAPRRRPRGAPSAGIDGIVVSNHGGRQVDGALARARRPARDRRRGRRRARGPVRQRNPHRAPTSSRRSRSAPTPCCVGRPYLWGLALDGQAGVETVLRMLLAELDLTLALSGYAGHTELDRDALSR